MTDRTMIVQDGFVPVLDLSAARAGDAEARRAVAATIDDTCRGSGFLVITGHRVDPDLISRMHEVTLRFFGLPVETRLRWSTTPGSPALRGLFRSEGSVAAAEGVETAPDICELFTVNRLGEPGVATVESLGDAFGVWSEPNRWPDQPADFRPVWLEYYAAMEEFATDVMRLFALALGVDEHHFDDKIDDHITNLTANFYPPIDEEPREGQYRKGPHSDWGSLTILYQDDSGGLEVVDGTTGQWTSVPVVPGSYVINIGDLMTRWTNGRWRSTKHRVRVPPAATRSQARISIPFFHTPNWDAVIETIPTCRTDESDPEPISSGDFLARKVRAAYGR